MDFQEGGDEIRILGGIERATLESEGISFSRGFHH
jgi:hypothetical protein